jgi:hypothetical protein
MNDELQQNTTQHQIRVILTNFNPTLIHSSPPSSSYSSSSALSFYFLLIILFNTSFILFYYEFKIGL